MNLYTVINAAGNVRHSLQHGNLGKLISLKSCSGTPEIPRRGKNNRPCGKGVQYQYCDDKPD